jgi:preprotein translocase subunit SecB
MATGKPKLAKADSYTEFVRSLDLIIIALTSSSARIKRAEFFEAKGHDLSIAVKLEPKRLSRDYFDLEAQARLRLTSKRSDSLINLSATYELHFHAKPPIDAKHVHRFADSDAHFILWPYLREYVSDVSARMYIPPIMLPVSK